MVWLFWVKFSGFFNITPSRLVGFGWCLKFASHHVKIHLSYCRLHSEKCRRRKIPYGIIWWKPLWAGHLRVWEWMLKHIKWGLILNLLMSAFLVASLKSSEYFFDVSSFPGPLWIGSEFRHLWIDLRTINYI